MPRVEKIHTSVLAGYMLINRYFIAFSRMSSVQRGGYESLSGGTAFWAVPAKFCLARLSPGST